MDKFKYFFYLIPLFYSFFIFHYYLIVFLFSIPFQWIVRSMLLFEFWYLLVGTEWNFLFFTVLDELEFFIFIVFPLMKSVIITHMYGGQFTNIVY